jgi:hypothetical protein
MSRTAITVLVLCLATSGCASVGMSVLSAALGLGANHQLNGTASKTFTESQKLMETAVVTALERMGMKIDARENIDAGRVLKASAVDRSIDVALEAITPTTTRVSATTWRTGSLFMDGATSAEVVAQTEKSIEIYRQAATPGAVSRSAAATPAGGFAPTTPAAAPAKRAATAPTKPMPKSAKDDSIVRWELR